MGLNVAVGFLATAAAVGASLIVVQSAAAALALAALLAWLPLARFARTWVAIASGLLPFTPVLIVQAGGLALPVADVIAIAAIVSCVAVANRGDLGLSSVVPLFVLITVYLGVAAWATVPHASGLDGWITWLQRAEMLVVWVFLGGLAYRRGYIPMIVASFLVGCCVLAAIWYVERGTALSLAGQKNASGGYLASGILVALLADIRQRERLVIVLWLSGGLVLTGSRGSIIGLFAGAIVALVVLSSRRRLLVPGVVALGAALLAMVLLPQQSVDRLLSRTEEAQTSADFREQFRQDVLHQWHQLPSGVGVGNYQQFDPALRRIGNDPHNPWLLALVEGGYPLLAAFILLCAGTIGVAFAASRRSEAGRLALCIQTSVLAHVYFDVYWMRGTPSAGLLFCGAACAALFAQRPAGRTGRTDRADQPFQAYA